MRSLARPFLGASDDGRDEILDVLRHHLSILATILKSPLSHGTNLRLHSLINQGLPGKKNDYTTIRLYDYTTIKVLMKSISLPGKP